MIFICSAVLVLVTVCCTVFADKVTMMSPGSNAVTRLFKWCGSIISDLKFNARHRGELSGAFSCARGSFNDKRHGVVTGALGGIGEELVKVLTELKFDVSIVARPQKLEQLIEFAASLRQSLCGKDNDDLNDIVKVAPCDLSIGEKSTSLDPLCENLCTLADKITSQHHDRLDMVLHSAGLMASTASERDIHAVNHLSPLALSLMLLPALMRSNCYDPSLLFISSSSHLRAPNYSSRNGNQVMAMSAAPGPSSLALTAYAAAKLNLLLSTTALHKRFRETGIVIKNVHPGLVDTPMLQGYFGAKKYPGRSLLFRSPREGSASVLLSLFRRTTEAGGANRPAADKSKSSILNGDYRAMYEVNGYPAMNKCSDFVNDDREVEQCFRDTVQQLPKKVKQKIASDARAAANSLKSKPSDNLVSFTGFSPARPDPLAVICANRRKALLELAREIEAS